MYKLTAILVIPILLSIVSVPVTAQAQNLNLAKTTCAELGFTPGTEKFGECVLRIMDADLDGAPAAAPKKPTPAPVTRVVTERIEVEGVFESLPGGYELLITADDPGYEDFMGANCGHYHIYNVKNEARGVFYGYVRVIEATGSDCELTDFVRHKQRSLERFTDREFSDSDVFEVNYKYGRATVAKYVFRENTFCAVGMGQPRQRIVVMIQLCSNDANVANDVVSFLDGMTF